ncbi:hypothetical protein MKZ38_004968 [Zalerion maritima]|uniref:Uncharacterized protein n=1 Tax=Zalerion maritima TaxID=339359 RepID=A0AAD5RLA3_9PEZI|nr:hypothetical protein MKZ38_004968 [Zalerion maritima]
MTTPDSKIEIPQRRSLTPTYHRACYPPNLPFQLHRLRRGEDRRSHRGGEGGGTGIGLAIAISFAQAGCGSVAILGRRADVLSSAAGTSRRPPRRTRRSPRSRRNAARSTFLCANAGVATFVGGVAEVQDPKVVVVDATGKNPCAAWNSVAAFARHRREEGAYAVGKTATLKAMMYFALEYPDVHFVYIQPGVVPSDLHQGVNAHDEPALPGNFVVWLTTEEAKFLRDKFVWANWDVDELLGMKEKIVNEKLLRWNLIGFPHQA